ncbi:hypothetical protein SEA_WATERT_77 [Microbacterium phage WaterT]|nr:hypothetical protein SEA_WATERT_77 [Microbacterium phage WaterT]QDK01478.1 hypothetical protein SEA_LEEROYJENKINS_82 [Microbacterium phage LeeroyJenkins]USH44532.1 hypothetical protein SEA_CASSITA_78 [Microbacterium phage Cassita]
MTNKDLPGLYALSPDLEDESDFIFSAEYKHWTVADVIEMLQDHDPDARVWLGDESNITDDGGLVYLRPLEMIYGAEGEVVL